MRREQKKENPWNKGFLRFRAEDGTRTRDLRITNALLYQLSYFGEPSAKVIHFFELTKIKEINFSFLSAS